MFEFRSTLHPYRVFSCNLTRIQIIAEQKWNEFDPDINYLSPDSCKYLLTDVTLPVLYPSSTVAAYNGTRPLQSYSTATVFFSHIVPTLVAPAFL